MGEELVKLSDWGVGDGRTGVVVHGLKLRVSSVLQVVSQPTLHD
jgi:hypothetical protein